MGICVAISSYFAESTLSGSKNVLRNKIGNDNNADNNGRAIILQQYTLTHRLPLNTYIWFRYESLSLASSNIVHSLHSISCNDWVHFTLPKTFDVKEKYRWVRPAILYSEMKKNALIVMKTLCNVPFQSKFWLHFMKTVCTQ